MCALLCTLQHRCTILRKMCTVGVLVFPTCSFLLLSNLFFFLLLQLFFLPNPLLLLINFILSILNLFCSLKYLLNPLSKHLLMPVLQEDYSFPIRIQAPSLAKATSKISVTILFSFSSLLFKEGTCLAR